MTTRNDVQRDANIQRIALAATKIAADLERVAAALDRAHPEPAFETIHTPHSLEIINRQANEINQLRQEIRDREHQIESLEEALDEQGTARPNS